MARTRDTGEGDDYSPDEADQLADWLEAELAAAEDVDSTDVMVEAQVEWAGTIDNNGRGGVRRTQLQGVDLTGTRAALTARHQARPSYTATGWHSQLRKLYDTPGGSEAATRAGLNPSRETARRWLSQTQAPSRANQGRIERAYRELATRPTRGSNQRVAREFTAALRGRYGVNVRLRGIRNFRIR